MDDRQKLFMFRWFFCGNPEVYAFRLQEGPKFGTYVPIRRKLTDVDIKAHFQGKIMLGSYPILPDGTTHWAAADFDGKNGNAFEHAKVLAQTLRSYGIVPLCNVSQSGKGVHVRIIFANHRMQISRDGELRPRPVHAAQARRFMMKVIEKAELPSLHEGGAFDRVFPSQDYLHPGGIGNQIAMPLNLKAANERGGSMFLDPSFNRIPLSESWDILENYKLLKPLDLFDVADEMGEVHHIFECVDGDYNFIGNRLSGRYTGTTKYVFSDEPIIEQNKKRQVTHQQLSFLLRGCDFIRFAASHPLSYTLWTALASQLAVYDNVGGKEIFHNLSARDGRLDNRGQPIYNTERTSRQYDNVLRTFRASYSCRKIAEEGWQCEHLDDEGCCTKFVRDDGRMARAPSKLPFYGLKSYLESLEPEETEETEQQDQPSSPSPGAV